MSDIPDDELISVPNPHTGRRLFQMGAAGLALGLIYLVNKSPVSDPLLLGMGTLVMVLGALPALDWARKSSAHFPVFEMFMLTCIPFYAVPLLTGHRDMMVFTDGATTQAGMAMLLFQFSAIATFTATRGTAIREPMLIASLLPTSTLRYAQTGMWLNTVYLYLNGFTGVLPYELATVLRAIFFGISTVSLFIEMRRWGAGRLPVTGQFVVVLNVLLQVLFLFRALYLIVGVSILLLALIGYVSTSRKLPLFTLAIALPIVALLHNGKAAMRLKYWGGDAPASTLAGLPEFFQEWIENGLNPPATEDGTEAAGLSGRLLERASLFQMLCLVTEYTPEPNSFLLGESYKYIPAQLVPSFLWPGKPSSLLSNVMLAIHYGLVPADSPTSVSIAFGMVAESYANFGLLGCALLGVVLGFGYKRVSLAAVGRPQFSSLGLLTILLAAWSFQAEQIFATWLVSLIQAGFVVIGIPLLIRTFFRQE